VLSARLEGRYSTTPCREAALATDRFECRNETGRCIRAGGIFTALSGDLKGFYSIRVNGNWRIIFRFDGPDVELVDYLDYH